MDGWYIDKQRAVSKDEANEISIKYGIKYIETSAKETINIDSLFIDTAKFLLSKQTPKNSSNNNRGNKYGIDLTNSSQILNRINNRHFVVKYFIYRIYNYKFH